MNDVQALTKPEQCRFIFLSISSLPLTLPMPELFHVNEKHGCGATIKLDTGEHCLVSIAQWGVIVRSYRSDSFLKGDFGSFFGPILFEERGLYEVVKIAMLLDIEYADASSPLELKNPILYAFAKAIWMCASDEHVSVVLNEAKSNAQKIENIDVATLHWANQRSKTRKAAQKIQTPSYGVIFSDNPIQGRDLTQSEIQSWADVSNNLFEENGIPCRILQIVGKNGTILWPPT